VFSTLDLAPLSDLLFARQEGVDGGADLAQRDAQPRHLLDAVLDVLLDDQEVEVTVR
jgi:hypothetical protein